MNLYSISDSDDDDSITSNNLSVKDSVNRTSRCSSSSQATATTPEPKKSARLAEKRKLREEAGPTIEDEYYFTPLVSVRRSASPFSSRGSPSPQTISRSPTSFSKLEKPRKLIHCSPKRISPSLSMKTAISELNQFEQSIDINRSAEASEPFEKKRRIDLGKDSFRDAVKLTNEISSIFLTDSTKFGKLTEHASEFSKLATVEKESREVISKLKSVNDNSSSTAVKQLDSRFIYWSRPAGNLLTLPVDVEVPMRKQVSVSQ